MRINTYLSVPAISAALMFIFLIVMSVINHSAGAVLMTFIVLGLIFGWSGYARLDKYDKLLVIGFLVLLAVMLIEYLLWPEAVNARYILKQFLRIGFASIIILLFRKYDFCSAKYVFRGALVAAPVMLAVAVYQVVGGIARAEGAVGRMQFGEFAAIVAVLSFLMAIMNVHEKKLRWLGVVSAIIATSVVFLSETRTALLYEITGILIALAYFIYSKRISVRTSVLVVLGVIVTIFVLSLFGKGFFQRFEGLPKAVVELSKKGSTQSGQLGARIKMWKEAVILWKESPVIGKGLGNYGIEAIKRRESGEFPSLGSSTADLELGTPHSIYFELLADTGVIGLMIFLITIIVIPLWIFFRKLLQAQNDIESMVALSGLQVVAGFTIFGITESWYIYSSPVAVFLLLSISMATSNKCRSL